jgi:hypothetical protein
MRIPEAAIMAVASLFTEANGNPLNSYEKNEIDLYNLAGVNPEVLADALQKAILEDSEDGSSYRISAYFCLGKKFDRSLLPFFQERLKVELMRDLDASYQIMIGLDNLEEPIFSPRRDGSYSIFEQELNRQDAVAYLKLI